MTNETASQIPPSARAEPDNTSLVVAALYKFAPLTNRSALQARLIALGEREGIKGTLPWPWQVPQGSVITVPRPWQRGQVCCTEKNPCCMRTWP